MTSCPDCPDLLAEHMPPGWKPRATCCRDEHLARRLDGSFEPWEGAEKAREAADRVPGRNRAERRANAAKARKDR